MRVGAAGNCGYRSCQKGLEFFKVPVTSSMQELRHQLYELVIDRFRDLPSLVYNMKGETHCNVKNGQKSNAHDYEWLDQIYTPGENLEGGNGPNDALDVHYWMNDHVTLPLFALKFKRSFFCYNTLNKTTSMFLYDQENGTVQYAMYEKGYVSSPEEGSVAIVYNGTNHFEWLQPMT